MEPPPLPDRMRPRSSASSISSLPSALTPIPLVRRSASGISFTPPVTQSLTSFIRPGGMRSSAPPLESPANRTQSRTAGGPDINSISRLGSRQVSTRAQSRHSAAASVRPSTTGSAYGDGGSYVVAVLRSKSAGVEVGLAAINMDTGRMSLTQVADNNAFAKTVSFLTVHPPHTVLISDTEFTLPAGSSASHSLTETIENHFQLQCTSVPRQQWNKENGLDLLKRFCLDDETKSSLLTIAASRYYALCATSALLLYVSAKKGVHFQERSVMIKYETLKGHMFIDADTARDLELVSNNLTTKANNTLFSTLNSCYTVMGTRLLRSSILQPSNTEKLINKRLEVVEELVNSPSKLREIRKNLKPLEKIDFDRLISSFVQSKESVGDAAGTEYRISLLLQLRTVVNTLPELAAAALNSSSGILDIAERAFSHPDLFAMRDIIESRITIETTLSGNKSSKGALAKNAKLFAIKEDFNPLLDLARSTYQENLGDIMELLGTLEEEHGITARLEWHGSGYRFYTTHQDIEGLVIPNELVNVEHTKKGIKFSTRELLKRNARLQQTESEVFSLSDSVVNDTMAEVVKHISCLYACSEAIALLDMLTGFAVISSAHQSVRPTFGKNLALKSCRHPILETTLASGDCVPNDVYAADGPANFQLIQGPNMSGKSTYLRQVGLLTVQAMVGCFIPAGYASFKLHDALLTRLSNDDCPERSLSTFAAEMTSAATILGMSTKRSLVLIDELGRGTAPIEGIGLSHAIAERLIKTGCFVFFATHFKELSQTLCTYPGVVTLHLQIQNSNRYAENEAFGTTFQYKVIEGATQEEHYGLELAKLASLPPEVMKVAWKVTTKLNDLEEKSRNASMANAQAMRRKAIMELRGRLQSVIESSINEDTRLYPFLQKLRNDLLQTLENVQRVEDEANDDEDDEADK